MGKKNMFVFLNGNIELYKFGKGVSLSSQDDGDERWSSGIGHSYLKYCHFFLRLKRNGT